MWIPLVMVEKMMSRGGRGLENNDNLIRPQCKNCYQVAEDKKWEKEDKGGRQYQFLKAKDTGPSGTSNWQPGIKKELTRIVSIQSGCTENLEVMRGIGTWQDHGLCTSPEGSLCRLRSVSNNVKPLKMGPNRATGIICENCIHKAACDQ